MIACKSGWLWPRCSSNKVPWRILSGRGRSRSSSKVPTLSDGRKPRRSVVPNLSEVETLTPDMAILVEIFGDLGLIEGRWPIIGRNASWDRRLWPIPGFGRIEEHTGRAFRMELSEDDLFSIVREIAVPRDEAERLPKHGLSGAGSVESVLARLLGM